jgi:hypothetical protein
MAFLEAFVKTGELPSGQSTVVGNPQCSGEELELALLPASGQLIEQRPNIAQLYVDVETPQLEWAELAEASRSSGVDWEALIGGVKHRHVASCVSVASRRAADRPIPFSV